MISVCRAGEAIAQADAWLNTRSRGDERRPEP